jgi:hypothetical protein
MAQPQRKPADLLAKAREALAGLESERVDVKRRRDAALLNDADGEANRLQGRLEAQERAVRTTAAKVELLEAEVAKEAAERAERERQEKIDAVTALFSQRDAAAAALQDCLIGAERAFREIDEMNAKLREAWPFARVDYAPCLLTGGALFLAVQHFLYKIGARPEPLGGQIPLGGSLSFPGGKCPAWEFTHQPDKLPALVAVFDDATRLATAIMNGNRNSFLSPPLAAIAAAAPVNLADGSISTDTGTASNGSGVPSPPIVERTPQQVELGRLLVRQNELAVLDTPEALAEYILNGKRVAELSP